MATYEELKKRVAEGKKTTAQQGGTQSSYAALKERVKKERFEKDVRNVDSSYINLFVDTANNFFDHAEEDLGNVGWRNAYSAYRSKRDSYQDLDYRRSVIQKWMESNKDGLDADSYKSLSGILGDFSTNASGIVDSFSKAMDYYSQWDTEEAYNSYVAQQEDYEAKKNFDLESGQREIEELERRKAELQRSRNKPSNNYLTGNSSAQSTPYAAAQQGVDAGDVEISDLAALISQKKQYLNQAKYIQEGIALSAVANNADFAENSGYVGTKIDDVWGRLTSQYGMGFGDLTYEYINNQNGARDEIKRKARSYSSDGSTVDSSSFEEKGYDYMTEDEVAIYNYHYAKGGKEAAQKYLDSIQETLNHRKAAGMYTQMEGRTLMEMTFGVAAGLDQFRSGMTGAMQAITGEADYIPQSATQMASGMVREDLGDVGGRLPGWLGGGSVGQMGYDAITTTANMAPSILSSMAANMIVPGSGAVVGNAAMFASSAGNAYQEALNYGYDKNQARAYSTLVGASEAGLQYLLGGISSMGGKLSGGTITKMLDGVDNAFLRTAGKLGGNMLSEGAEEGLQEILTPLFKSWTLMADEDVNWSEVAYSSLLGALTGGVFEGSNIAIDKMNNKDGSAKVDVPEQQSAEMGKPVLAETAAPASRTNAGQTAVVQEGNLPTGEKGAPAAVQAASEESRSGNAALEEASRKYGAQAGAMVSVYNEGQDVESFDAAYQIAYDMGKSGVPQEYAVNNQATSYLTESQRVKAWIIGRDAAQAEAKKQQNQVSAGEVTSWRKGTVKGYDVSIDDLSKAFNVNQNRAYKVMSTLAEATGVDIVLYKSQVNEETGKLVGQVIDGVDLRNVNGAFVWNKDKIYIDVNAGVVNQTEMGDVTKYTMLRTFTHEFTHFAEKWSPEQYGEFRSAVFEAMTARGENVDDLITAEMAWDESLSYEAASREVIADAMTDILQDSTFVEQLSRKHENVFKKMLEKLKAFAKRIRDYFKSVNKSQDAGIKALQKEVEGGVRYLEDIVKMFDSMAVDAVENYQGRKNTAKEGGVVRYQLKEYSQHQKENWANSKRIVLYESEEQFRQFILNALHNKVQTNLKMYFGAIPSDLAADIMKATGINVEGYNLSIGENEIRKINKSHGSDRTEMPRGQRAVTEEDFLSIPKVVQSPDSISLSTEKYEGKPVIEFRQKNGSETIVVVAVVSDKRLDLFVQTTFINKKIGSIATPESVQADSFTSETSGGTAPTTSIPKNQNGVNRKNTNSNAQNQQRRGTLSDWEVLSKASEQMDTEKLTDGERDALRIFNKHLAELRKAEEQRREQGRLWHQNQFGENGDRREAQKARNRMDILDRRIQSERERLLSIEHKAVLQAVLQKAREVVEQQERSVGKERLENYRKNGIESRNKTAMRRKIRKIVLELNEILNRGSKKRNVKEGMKDLVTETLASADILLMDNYSNEDMLRNGVAVTFRGDEAKHFAEAQKLLQKLDSLPYGSYESYKTREGIEEQLRSKLDYRMSKLQGVFEAERKRQYETPVREVFNKIADAYKLLDSAEYRYIKGAYLEEAYQYIKGIADEMDGTVVRDMNLRQLRELYNVYTVVMTAVQNANKLFRNGRSEEADTRVKQIQSQLRKIAASDKDPSRTMGKIADWMRSFTWNELRPVDAFERLGSDAFTELFWDVIEAQSEYGRLVTEVKDVLAKARKDYNYSEWDMKKATTFKTVDGKKFKLTLADVMSIYAYSKRKQAHGHMTVGGFVFDTGRTYKEKGKTYIHKKLSEPYKVSDDDIQTIIETLTPEQHSYVDTVQKYMTEFGGKGNKVSRILYGIDLFNEEIYFPLKSEKDYRDTTEQALNNTQTMVSLKNSGMTKPTVPNATNPIVLQPFDDVVLEHLDRMAKYATYVLPIENLQRVYNGSKIEGASYVSTKALIGSVFGKPAQKYFEQFITDLNGGGQATGAQNPLMNQFSKSKAAAVSANLSVILQQPTSIVRAMSEVDIKHFVPFRHRSASKSDGKMYDELMKYAPVAVIKDMGGFDVSSSSGLKEYIGMEGAAWDRTRAWKAAQDLFGYGAMQMDRVGWTAIWSAVKKETAETTKLKPGTEEFLQAAGKRFAEVVTRTQVYDSVNSRSGYMRSKHDSVKYLTTYMGEPTVIVGMTYTSHLKMYRALKSGDRRQINKALKNHLRTDAVLLITAVLNGLAKSFAYAMRDDDEDEAFMERWVKQFGSAIMSDMNLFGLLPVFRDVVSLADGWTVERPDIALIQDLLDASNKVAAVMADEKKRENMTSEDWYELARGLVGSLGNVGGVPASNILRDLEGSIRLISDLTDDIHPVDIKGAFERGLAGEEKPMAESLYGAMMSGDRGRLEAIKETYKDENTYGDAVRKALRDYDPRIAEAAKAFCEEDFEHYADLFEEIRDEGIFAHNDIYSAIQSKVNELDDVNTPEESGAETGDEERMLFNAENYYDALLNNDSGSINMIYSILVSKEQAEGYLLHEAKDNIATALTAQVKRAYMAGQIGREKALEMLIDHTNSDEGTIKKWEFEMEYGYTWGSKNRAYRLGKISENELVSAYMDIEGASRGDAEAYVQFLDLEMANSDVSISANDAAGYFEFAKPAGIDIDTYLEYSSRKSQCVSDKDENGNTIQDSKKDKVLAVIHSLQISKEQKDALYYAAGYAESEIDDAPWR